MILISGEGTLYKFLVRQPDANGKLFEHLIVDPYARALVGRDGPGVTVWPKKKIHTFLRLPKKMLSYSKLICVISYTCENDLSPNQRREFAGLTKWLSSPDCYLREMGVNVVELQPVQEFDARTRRISLGIHAW